MISSISGEAGLPGEPVGVVALELALEPGATAANVKGAPLEGDAGRVVMSE